MQRAIERMGLSFLLALAACDLPPGAPPASGPDLGSPVTFDASAALDLELPPLDGNQLPLDGGLPFGHLVLTVTDGETGLPAPARVIFRPVPGSGYADDLLHGQFNPLSPGAATGATVGPGVLGSPEGVMLVSGQGVVPAPPGDYTLVFTRGPEYELVEQHVVVAAGDVQTLAVRLDRTVDTRGWLAADLHVHLGRSFDSRLPIERRAISMVSNGVEVIVTTDHNVNTDIQPTLDALGYGGELVGSVVGNEFNFHEGHAGAYPVPYDPMHMSGGAPPWQDQNPDGTCGPPVMGINCDSDTVAFPRMHAQIPGVTVVTVNHPFWPTNDLGYFTNIGWGVGTAHPPPAPLRSAGLFDALEVLNGYLTDDTSKGALVADWFWLLGQGYRVTALGNSDTHQINWVRSGWPRTWLRLPNDRPGDTTGVLLADAIRRGRAIASTGPFLTLAVDEALIGDTVIPKTAGEVAVEITVDAPKWIEVDTVRLYVNGVEKQRFAVPPGQRPVFHASFTEPIASDSWIVAQASGEQGMPGDLVGEYAEANGYQMKPFAITNPVFVDADGDGAVHPPASPIPSRPPGPPPGLRPPHGPVPRHCDPSELRVPGAGEEPPLEAAEAVLMPLLHLDPAR